jgi:hypothetical protein
MGRCVDFIVAMTYNSQSTTPPQFQTWMKDQTQTILRAVSGGYWNDAAHPAPTNGVKVFMGFAAYPPSRWHDPKAENCRYAARGVLDGLNQLETETAGIGQNYFQGAAVYLYTDGTGKDNYSNEDTDWKYFKQYWLN